MLLGRRYEQNVRNTLPCLSQDRCVRLHLPPKYLLENEVGLHKGNAVATSESAYKYQFREGELPDKRSKLKESEHQDGGGEEESTCARKSIAYRSMPTATAHVENVGTVGRCSRVLLAPSLPALLRHCSFIVRSTGYVSLKKADGTAYQNLPPYFSDAHSQVLDKRSGTSLVV